MFVVRVGKNGRITIPIAIRKALNINAGDVLDVKVEGKRIILRKIVPDDTSSDRTITDVAAHSSTR